MNKLIQRKGFSLAEMIISVAILAVMSIYLLKLFGNAQRLNDEAFELDGATNCLKSHLTIFQNEDGLFTDFAEKVEIAENQYPTFSSKIYLDSMFQKAEASHADYILVTDFREVEKMPNGEALFSVNAKIYRGINDEESQLVAGMDTNMIFHVDGGGK